MSCRNNPNLNYRRLQRNGCPPPKQLEEPAAARLQCGARRRNRIEKTSVIREYRGIVPVPRRVFQPCYWSGDPEPCVEAPAQMLPWKVAANTSFKFARFTSP